MSKIVSIALPAVLGIGGALIGGPLGADLGLSAGVGAGLGGAAGGALGSALTGGNPLLGAIGGGIGGATSGFGANGSGLIGSGAASGGASGAASVLASADDPIAALSNAMTMTGTSTATDAATALGYSNTNALLSAANPSWLTMPAAAQGITNNLTGGMIGSGGNVGSFTGTAGGVGGGAASNMSALSKLLNPAAAAASSGPVGGALSIGSGLYGLYQSQQMSELAKQMQASNTYSPQASAQLSQLLANPSSITSTPGYDAGMQAVQRSMAAQGYQGSGNMAAALQQYGGNFYNQQVQQLQGLASGGASTTGSALQGQALANQSASGALAALGYGAVGLGAI